MWTLILTLTLIHSGNPSISSVIVPNLPSKEVCIEAGEKHIVKYVNSHNNKWTSTSGVYSCVEQGKNE